MSRKTYEYLEANHDRFLAELVEFARIPSVSADPAYQDGITRAAQWVADQLTAAGLEKVRTIATARHPFVYGQWLGAPGAPTILVYGHYDVQPPDPLDKWESKPFEPTVRNGRLYARGVSDDKGPLFIAIKVAQAFLATDRVLPINVKFLVEGEEEIGSPNLEDFVRENAEWLAADWVLSADGAMWRIDEPSLTVASRGLAALEFTVSGASKDLHSGRHGGAVANPLHAMAQAVASLHTAEGRVAVAGFYDQVVALADEERAALGDLPFDESRYLQEVGAISGFGEPGYSLLERLWTRPTLELNGLWGGYQGQGSKTVIPSEAHAKISCRLVPNQDPQDIADKITRHLQAHLPPGVRLTIHADKHRALPYRIPDDHVGLKVAKAALRQVYGQPPLKVRMGATIPIAEAFKRYLKADTVFFSFSTVDEDYHAPNEFFRIHRLHEGLEAWARYWELAKETRVSV
jgi:acetylornithine deacetylase/succinyl-diaminopimelate desuccinylase-like protein